MNIAERLGRTIIRWHIGILAGRALNAAAYGDCNRGHDIAADVITRGPVAVQALAGAWCEAICADLPRSARRSIQCRPILMDQHGVLAPEDVPVRAMWMAQLVAAHMNRDQDMCRALVNAVPDDQIEAHLAGLLHAAAMAVAARSEDA